MSNDGAAPHGSAGAGGYVYADLAELDDVIGGWQSQSDDVRIDADLLTEAFYSLGSEPPDMVTTQYIAALAGTIEEFYEHTSAMNAYIAHHAAKLLASRRLMEIAEDRNAAMYSREGEA